MNTEILTVLRDNSNRVEPEWLKRLECIVACTWSRVRVQPTFVRICTEDLAAVLALNRSKQGISGSTKKDWRPPNIKEKSIKYLVNQEFFLLTVSGSILILFIFSYLIFSLPIFSFTLLVIWFTLGKNIRLCLVYYYSKMERRQIKIIS